MKKFLGIVRYEFSMSMRRPGFWIAYLLLVLFYATTVILPSVKGDYRIPLDQIWDAAGSNVFQFNIFFPLLAGLLAADRMQRDFRCRMRELQVSCPLSNSAYIMAKYLGVLAASLLPFFIGTVIVATSMVVLELAPVQILWPFLVAFLILAVPAHAFVVAFSLVCPLVIPLRVYQVLFTGYWFWGNLLSPKAFPTISDTLLNAIGQIPLQAFFNAYNSSSHPVVDGFTPTDAVLNLVVLSGCIAAALLAANFYLLRKASRA